MGIDMRVSIIGFGGVGQSVAGVLQREREHLSRKGLNVKVVAVTDLWGAMIDEDGLDLANVVDKKAPVVDMSSLDVIEQVPHDVMIESTPTSIDSGEPGMSHMLTALNNNRHVVTSNKGPLALNYSELMELADRNNLELRFEATVGGVMPMINLARECLAANEIMSIKGILNGTCNYILSRMTEDRLPYEHVLSEAQELGIAEADPTYDVEGIDTACKLVILANAVFNLNSTYRDVEVVGIEDITLEALKLADESGYVVKLIGEVRKDGTMRVAPRLVPVGHPLAVSGTLNAASIITDTAGEISVTGRGAGGMEAASAIVSDLVAVSKSGRYQG
jgi:homoserine dehydrogenase